MTGIPVIKDKIKINKLSDLVRIHLYTKMVEKEIESKSLTDRELLILCNLYVFGGVFSKDDILKFSADCFIKKLSDDSVQSIRNVLGKGRALGIVKRARANKWVISQDYLPKIDSDKLILQYTFHNLDIDI